MGTRKECREALTALFSAAVFTGGIYEYLPTDLQGATKALAVYINRANHEVISGLMRDAFYHFNVDTLVKRAGATSEDDLDTLHEEVRSACRAAAGNNGTWNEITLEEVSECFFTEISGLAYRVEQHKVKLKATA